MIGLCPDGTSGILIGRGYETPKEEHSNRPFRAVLADSNPSGNPSVLLGAEIDDSIDYDALDETDPRRAWKAPRSKIIRRDAVEMAAAVETLLKHCTRVLFVDKHFGPENVRHRLPFEQFMLTLANRETGHPPSSVEVHTGNKADCNFFRTACQRTLARVIPTGMNVRFVRWDLGDLHNRFILTDRGGVAFLEGLDQDLGSTRTEDVVVVLDQDVSRQLLLDYDPKKTTKLTFVDEFNVAGTSGVRAQR